MKSIDVELGIMPILAVEAPGLDSSSLSSFTGSNKRKSFENPEKAEDAANQENNSPNVPKKTASPMPQSATKKFKDALMNGQTVLHNGANLFMQPAAKSLDEASSIPSPLPRFNAAVKKITMVVPPAQETKRHVTEQKTAERGAPTPIKAPPSSRKTPSKRDVAMIEEKTLGPRSNCYALIKRLKAAISNLPSPEVIRAHFDSGFTITEERVAGIFAHLKIKNKWDFKEKAKKQDVVIKELRDCLTTTLGEIKAVRKQCLLHENHVHNLLLDSYEESFKVPQILSKGAVPGSLIKRLKKATPEVIRDQFDNGFTIAEEQVSTIFAHMKVKNKWDFKERAKKQDAVLKELRDCMAITLNEIKAVREKCLLHESQVNNLLRDTYEEFFEVSQNLSTLHATTSTTMTDELPLSDRNKEFETRIHELQVQLVLEQIQADQLATDYAKLQAEHAELKSKSETVIASMKEEYEQRIEKSLAGYRDEVATLRAELKHRQSDTDRNSDADCNSDERTNLDDDILRNRLRVCEVETA